MVGSLAFVGGGVEWVCVGLECAVGSGPTPSPADPDAVPSAVFGAATPKPRLVDPVSAAILRSKRDPPNGFWPLDLYGNARANTSKSGNEPPCPNPSLKPPLL